jgi:hypothetical protein
MAADQLAKVNQTLGSGGEVTPDTARRMGLFVVSRLSQRHGLSTSLRSNDEGGTTATVTLPVAILPELAAPATPKPRGTTLVPVPTKASKNRAPKKADRKPKKPDPKPAPVKAKDEAPATMDVQARIDAAMGLPARRPGATVNGVPSAAPEPVTPSTASAALAALRPLSGRPGAAKEALKRDATAAPEPAVRPAEPTVQPMSRLSDLPTRGSGAAAEPVADVTEPIAAAEPVIDVTEPVADVTEPVGEPQVASVAEPVVVPVPVSEAKPTPAPLAANGALDGDWMDPGADGFDTPIFRSLRSAWLSTGDDAQPWRRSEIEVGWEVADQVAETPAEPKISQSGLPVRRPGTRLVPGGVTTTPTATVRDPEAIRARLAAHASGVSRGRAATATPDHPQTEAGS